MKTTIIVALVAIVSTVVSVMASVIPIHHANAAFPGKTNHLPPSNNFYHSCVNGQPNRYNHYEPSFCG